MFKKWMQKLALIGLALGALLPSIQMSVLAQENVEIDKLVVGFVPSRDPEEIVAQTEPLADLLIDELAKLGYDVGEVEITVGTSYEAVGEGLSAGTIDVGLIPGGTYVLYDDGAEVILTSTRKGFNIDSDDAKDWNETKPTEQVDDQVTFYRSLMIAGPSEKGRELAEKVNNGEELTWEDVNSATWSVMGPTSSSGYIYPSIHLNELYGKTISELESVVQADSYLNSFARLATQDVDVVAVFADARLSYEEDWVGDLGAENDIWEDTDVILVSSPIYNDTVSVSKNSEIIDEDFIAALQEAFINIAKTDEGKEVIAIYSHEGYEKATSEDYDVEREAQKILREQND